MLPSVEGFLFAHQYGVLVSAYRILGRKKVSVVSFRRKEMPIVPWTEHEFRSPLQSLSVVPDISPRVEYSTISIFVPIYFRPYQYVRRLKLASIGRCTGSIFHKYLE